MRINLWHIFNVDEPQMGGDHMSQWRPLRLPPPPRGSNGQINEWYNQSVHSCEEISRWCISYVKNQESILLLLRTQGDEFGKKITLQCERHGPWKLIRVLALYEKWSGSPIHVSMVWIQLSIQHLGSRGPPWQRIGSRPRLRLEASPPTLKLE